MSKDTKICKRCNARIDEKKDRYTHVEDWDKGKFVCDSWWHLNCFLNSMNRELTEMEKTAQKMLKQAQTVYGNIPEEFKEEVYYLK